jgi:uncharacterized protein (DUF1778 family)
MYDFIPYMDPEHLQRKSTPMARALTESGRIELRIKPDEKALLSRAAALQHEDLTGFILKTVLPAAERIVEQAERLELSERDSLRVLKLLENPPKPSAKLRAAARRHSKIFGRQ